MIGLSVVTLYRCEGRTQQRLKERLFALEEQKQLDSEATEDQTRKKEEDVERVKKQGNYRDELDTELEEKKKNEAAEMQQMKTDDEKRNIYTKTKKVRLHRVPMPLFLLLYLAHGKTAQREGSTN